MSRVRCEKTKRGNRCRLTLGHLGFHQYDNKQWWPLRRWVIARANGQCQAAITGTCTNVATEAHHVLPRSRGGPDELGNLIATCGNCHRWIHANVADAAEMGLLQSATREAS